MLTLAGLKVAVGADKMNLETVLAQIDQTATKFHTAQADFVWTTFNSVVNEIASTDTGKIYFERSGNDVKMSATMNPPDAEEIVFSEGKIEIYRPKLNTVDVYDSGAHRDEFEAFLVLGFLKSGDEMRKSFDVKYDGQETIDGIDAAKLDLAPRAENIQKHFPQIVLWIDPENGISVQQKLVETNGDYRLAKYSHIQLGKRFSGNVFKLKTHGATTTTNH